MVRVSSDPLTSGPCWDSRGQDPELLISGPCWDSRGQDPDPLTSGPCWDPRGQGSDPPTSGPCWDPRGRVFEGRGIQWTGSQAVVGFRVCGQCSVMPLPLQVTSGSSLLGAEAREEYLRLVGSMQQKLQAAQYNSSYFDRGAKAGRRLCTPEGWFSCQVSCRRLLGHPGRGLVSWGNPRVPACTQ